MECDKVLEMQVDKSRIFLGDVSQCLGDTSHFYVSFSRIKICSGGT